MTNIQLVFLEIMQCLLRGTKKVKKFPPPPPPAKKGNNLPVRHGKKNLLLYLHQSYTMHLETQNLEVVFSASVKRKVRHTV